MDFSRKVFPALAVNVIILREESTYGQPIFFNLDKNRDLAY